MKLLLATASLLLLSCNFSLAQLNIDSIGHIDLNAMHNQELNDVWGYVDEFGNEYAIAGGSKGVSIVDLSTPSNPTETFFAPGLESVWRDIKTWGDYAYITTEADAGLTIIDLSPLPASSALTTTVYTGAPGNNWDSAHNLYIDSAGYCYIFGSDRGNGGVIILDLNIDPMNPVEVGVFDTWYAHDGFVENDTMYAAHIFDGFFSVVDVQDRSNPILLGTAVTPSSFAHNVWTSNGQYAFTTDEVSGGFIGAFDISDPQNIVEVDRIQSSPGAGIIPHNTHVRQNHIITSYYADGVVVHDITYPYNLVEIGNYDTYPDQTASYNGCWGVFPFFPSGLIVASDITEGLFVLSPAYTQAAYLEGLIRDASTLSPINNASVEILGGNQIDASDFSGFYATGIATGGAYAVNYSKIGYYPQSIPITISNGIITTVDVNLSPIPQYAFTVNVLDLGTGNPIDNAQVRLEADLITHEGSTNALGAESFMLYYEEYYKIYVGKWGHVTHCDSVYIDNSTGSITVYLEEGIYDDFVFDFNWTVTGSAVTGQFERAIPFGTAIGTNPGEDAPLDCGDYCYVTGNAANLNADFDDVDGGNTVLKSPVMDLTGFSDPYVNYARFFYNYFGPIQPFDDSLKVSVSNGLQTAVIDIVGSDTSIFFEWLPQSIRLLDYISLTSNMQFTFETSDNDPEVNITEAAIDYFFIAEGSTAGVKEIETAVRVYPNPTETTLHVETERDGFYRIMNLNGQMMADGEIEQGTVVIDVSGMDSGIYLIYVDEKVFRFIKTN